jgi:thiol-disulfide isomerase/thioredoxin
MIDLRNERVLVALFVQAGCPACEEFHPRFDRLADRYKRAGMPIMVYDAAAKDPGLIAFMDKYQVYATPTLLILKRGPGSYKVEGSLDDETIEETLMMAYQVHARR